MNKKIIYTIKLVITIAVLYYLFRNVNFKEIVFISKKISIGCIILLLFTSFLKLLTQCVNWKIYLNLFTEKSVSIFLLIKTFFIGLALQLVLPGGVASFGKVFYLDGNKKNGLIAIGMEKIIQFWGNIIFGAWTSLLIFNFFNIYIHIFLVVIITFLPLIVLFFRSFFKKRINLADSKNLFYSLILVMIIQVFYVLLTVSQYFFILNIFRKISFLDSFFSSTLILLSNNIPITIQGLGLRESFAIYFLKDYSFTKEEAVLSAFMIFVFNAFIPALIGAFMILKNNNKK